MKSMSSLSQIISTTLWLAAYGALILISYRAISISQQVVLPTISDNGREFAGHEEIANALDTELKL